MESSDSGQIRPYQLEPYVARRPEGEEVAAGVDVVRVGNTDWYVTVIDILNITV